PETSGPSGNRGVRPHDQVDLAVPQAGGRALPAPRRTPRRDERRTRGIRARGRHRDTPGRKGVMSTTATRYPEAAIEADKQDHEFRGCCHTVGEDKIVQTFTWMGMPDQVSLETMWFEDLGDGT